MALMVVIFKREMSFLLLLFLCKISDVFGDLFRLNVNKILSGEF